MIRCPRREDGSPDYKDDAPKDYLANLAIRRGLPYPEALAAARRMKREQRRG